MEDFYKLTEEEWLELTEEERAFIERLKAEYTDLLPKSQNQCLLYNAIHFALINASFKYVQYKMFNDYVDKISAERDKEKRNDKGRKES